MDIKDIVNYVWPHPIEIQIGIYDKRNNFRFKPISTISSKVAYEAVDIHETTKGYKLHDMYAKNSTIIINLVPESEPDYLADTMENQKR